MRYTAIAATLLAAACAEMPRVGGDANKPAAPQITESSLRERAQQQLADGVKQYDAGEYDNAVKNLTSSLEHGLLSKAEQARARKYLAFSHCVSGREILCRDEFRKAFEINPDFSLTPAEDGHPVWGPVYRDVRTQLIAEREAATTVGSTGAHLDKAQQMLADGMVKYDSGEYEAARRLLEAALAEGLKDPANQVKAMKFIAFAECLQRRYKECRAEFIRIYDVDPNFDLAPAEAGHPSWTNTFASAKATAKRALAAKEAKEKAARDKGAIPPAASVPKK
jgi:tetratricopeptide (TPR) repeat protein